MRAVTGDFIRGTLFDRNGAAVPEAHVYAGRGACDVKGNLVASGEHGERIRADLVCDVPIGRYAVGSYDHRVHFSRAIRWPAIPSVMSVTGIAARTISHAVSRAP
jgi:hypothetical protein